MQKSRRQVLMASGVALAGALAGCSGNGDSGGGGGDGGSSDGGSSDGGGGSVPSEVDDYLSEAKNYDGSVTDMTGKSSVTVDVGAGSSGLAFGPAAVRVDSGTTVTWKWTGNGGSHNVQHKGGAFKSKTVGEKGHTFKHTFEKSGNFLYFCSPHKALGMKGAVIVE